MIMIAIHNLILSMTILQNTTADNSIPLIKKSRSGVNPFNKDGCIIGGGFTI